MACNCAQGYKQPMVNRTACGCQQGYSGPWPYGSGLGRPYGMAYALGGPPMPLMGRLMGATTLPAGSHFRQGYKFNAWYSCGDATLNDQITGCLYTTGAFNNVLASCSESFPTIHSYLLIEGDTAIDFAQASDLTGLITDTLKNCVNAIDFVSAVSSVDTLMIDTIPQEFAGNPNYQQPSTGPGSLYQMQQQQAASGSPGNPPSTCDWNSMSIGQYLACQLGFSDPIKSATAGVAIGVAAVVGILLLAKR
ncbi:MAG: hypothetical protein J2P41_00175 [Blastocatellia bacterium]|nr:hypothetical protein [Blastocatellia bacterium]